MSPYSADTVVIGAGLIGLAAARALALAGREVVVLEANGAIGQESSSRNSEVLHAGIYYPPASLKARTCIRGRRLLDAYCRQRGIALRRLGKLVVAADEDQLPRLDALRQNALACGADGLETLGPAQLEQMEPAVRGAGALYSAGTGIIDSHALMLALQADLEAAGGIVVLNSRVTAGERLAGGICRLRLQTPEDTFLDTRLVINAAGLGATDVARAIDGFPGRAIPRQYFARGHYFTYPGRAPFSHLVYPLPAHGGLGIHATLDLAGQVRFGPDSQYCSGVDYRFDPRRQARFSNAIRRWFPQLDEARLQPGYVGVRPRLAGPREDFADFVISGPTEHGVAGIINLFGIESPGLTACLALAEEVAARVGGGR